MSKGSSATSIQNDPAKKAFKVYNFIVGKGGELDFSELVKHPSPLHSFSKEEALGWLKEFADLDDKEAIIEKPCFAVRTNSEGRVTVRVVMKVRLCLIYEKNGHCKHGSECKQWHVCKGFLEGSCTDTNLCSRSHDLADKENLSKALKYRLEKLSNSSIRKVIVKNLPFLCENYVNNECLNPLCQNLHLCSRLVKAVCADEEENCPLRISHDLSSHHNKRIFSNFAVPSKYALCHILVSQETNIEVVVKGKDGKRKGKVNKLNNLNSNEDEKQVGEFSKLTELPQNILPNVPENQSSKLQKNKERRSKQKKNVISNEPNSRPENFNIHPGLLPNPYLQERLRQRQVGARGARPENSFQSFPPNARGRHGHPVPLMGFPAKPPGNIHQLPFGPNRSPNFQEAFHDMLFPQDHEANRQRESARGGMEHNKRGGMNQMQRGGRKWRSMDNVQPPSRSAQFSFESQKEEVNKPMNMRDEVRGGRGGRGRGSWRGRGRGIIPHDAEVETPEKEPSCPDSLLKEEEASTEQTDAKRGRRRSRTRVRKRKSGSNPDSEGKTNLDDEEVDELKEDLMEFRLEDEEVEEEDLMSFGGGGDDDSNLVDLNFDSEQGLSQMSEGQAMWEIFSQDQLYNYDSLQDNDHNLTASNSTATDNDDGCQSSDSSDVSVASLKAVFNCIVKEFNGTVSFSEISAREDLFHPGFEEKERWFKKRESSFLVIENSEGDVVEIKTFSLRAKMCFKYYGKGCNSKSCTFFHICKEYVAKGRCNEVNCRRNHGFTDNHNKHIASRLLPQDHLTDEQLRCLVQSSTLQVCLDYNNHRCPKGKQCTRIHICKNYGYKRCPRGTCKLAHNNGLSTPATKDILNRFRIKGPPEMNGFILAKTLLICDDVPVVEKPPTVKERGRPKSEPVAKSSYHIQIQSLGNHICMKFLLKRCEKGPKCLDHHCPMPYQWVYLTDHKWNMLSENENTNLERFFCQETVAEAMMPLTVVCSSSSTVQAHLQNITYIYNVDFNKMQISPLDEEGQHFTIKRLSTESEVHIPDCPLATQWHWFWKGPDEKFVEYKPTQGAKGLTSATVERHYLEGHSMYDFSVKPHNYRLYFRKKPMCQKNMDPEFFTERDVCRRPRYISNQDFETLRSKHFKLPAEDSRQIPHSWKKMEECQEFLLFQLRSSSKEFKDMQTLFLNSIGDKQVTINSIDRVQNPFMMEKYLRKQNHMQKHGESVDERLLFHGTSHRNIRPICKQNFDWRLYGEVTGNKYGEGAYFARDSSLSDCYCPEDDDGLRYIFIAKVLVGSFTKGEKTYKRPPHKDDNDPHSDLHDSCVDSVNNPKIFVVFDVDQYYPGYLVEYTRQDTENLRDFSSGMSVSKRQAPPPPTATPYGAATSSPRSPTYVHPGMNQMSSSRNVSPPRPNLATAMERQVDEYAYTTGKKSSQQNCSVM